MTSPLYPQQIINSLNPKCEKIFIMCHKIGFPPISIMGFGFTDDIPKTVKELDLMTRDAYLKSAHRDQNIGKIAIAYTIWSKKRGGGKLIVKEVFKMIKKSNHLNRLITLSPLTEMARNFHLNNGAIELQVNQDTQNFEYKI